jgi:hypothetical protein
MIFWMFSKMGGIFGKFLAITKPSQTSAAMLCATRVRFTTVAYPILQDELKVHTFDVKLRN